MGRASGAPIRSRCVGFSVSVFRASSSGPGMRFDVSVDSRRCEGPAVQGAAKPASPAPTTESSCPPPHVQPRLAVAESGESRWTAGFGPCENEAHAQVAGLSCRPPIGQPLQGLVCGGAEGAPGDERGKTGPSSGWLAGTPHCFQRGGREFGTGLL